MPTPYGTMWYLGGTLGGVETPKGVREHLVPPSNLNTTWLERSQEEHQAPLSIHSTLLYWNSCQGAPHTTLHSSGACPSPLTSKVMPPC